MKLDNEDTGKGLKLVPETYGMNVPSACTIVIIAGIDDNQYPVTVCFKNLYFTSIFR